MATKTKVLIMGAAGRDFHNFNMYFRDNEAYEVVAFTATQIPHIDDRKYPAELAGRLYPDGIPIHDEAELGDLVERHDVDQVVFAYSDVPYSYVMHRSAQVNAAGRRLPSPRAEDDDDQEQQAGDRRLRRAHRLRQEPDDAQDPDDAARGRQEGRQHPPPDALRRSRQAARAALRDPRRPHEARLHHRGDGGVRAAHRRRQRDLRRRRLRGHRAGGGAGGRRHPLGRRQQRLQLLSPPTCTSRSPTRIAPATILRYYPGEVNLRLADVVVLNKIDTADRADIEAELANVALGQPGRHDRHGRLAGHGRRSAGSSAASGCSWSRTARRSRTAR